jgi:cytochrome c biogenesis protein CcdA
MLAEAIVAFLGGLLSLLSPCSALLLPAFFAYAFGSPGRLVARTGIFYAGLLTLFVPLGLGLGAISALVLVYRPELTLVAGLLLIGIGLYQLAVGGFAVPGAAGLPARVGGESAGATYALGLVYGISGFCAGPILGGVLTIAATSGGALAGGILLAIFAAGMAMPLLVLALVWEHLGLAGRRRLRGREFQLGPVRRHSSIIASSLLFIALGSAFIVFQGGNALSAAYAAVGLSDLGVRLESGVGAAVSTVPGPVLLAASAMVVVAAWLARHRGSRAQDDGQRHEQETS